MGAHISYGWKGASGISTLRRQKLQRVNQINFHAGGQLKQPTVLVVDSRKLHARINI